MLSKIKMIYGDYKIKKWAKKRFGKVDRGSEICHKTRNWIDKNNVKQV